MEFEDGGIYLFQYNKTGGKEVVKIQNKEKCEVAYLYVSHPKKEDVIARIMRSYFDPIHLIHFKFDLRLAKTPVGRLAYELLCPGCIEALEALEDELQNGSK